MSEVTIKITTAVNKTSWSTFINTNRLSSERFAKSNVKVLKIDIRECQFMEPFYLVSLACLIEEYYLQGVQIEFIQGNNIDLNDYLSGVNFFNYWSAQRNESIYLPATQTTTLNLWKISNEMISGYADTAQKYFEQNYISDKNLMPLSTSLSELFLNIFDHSKSPISGFCLTQYYPNVGKIKFSVCDFGIGIPTSINNYLRSKDSPILSEMESLMKAFELHFTTQSTPRNRGRGLDNIKGIITSNKGVLRVISNSVCYIMDNGKVNSYSTKVPFNGTHFELVLDVKNLTEKNGDLEDFDFS